MDKVYLNIIKRIDEEIHLLRDERKDAMEYDDEQVIFAVNNQLRAFNFVKRIIFEEVRIHNG